MLVSESHTIGVATLGELGDQREALLRTHEKVRQLKSTNELWVSCGVL